MGRGRGQESYRRYNIGFSRGEGSGEGIRGRSGERGGERHRHPGVPHGGTGRGGRHHRAHPALLPRTQADPAAAPRGPHRLVRRAATWPACAPSPPSWNAATPSAASPNSPRPSTTAATSANSSASANRPRRPRSASPPRNWPTTSRARSPRRTSPPRWTSATSASTATRSSTSAGACWTCRPPWSARASRSPTSSSAAKRVRAHAEDLAELFTDLVLSHATEDDLQRLRPLAKSVVEAELSLALDRALAKKPGE